MQEAAGKRGSRELPSIDGYELGELLGQGAMGAVYRAVRRSDGQPVAVKIMLAKIAVNETQRDMFLREIDDHPPACSTPTSSACWTTEPPAAPSTS